MLGEDSGIEVDGARRRARACARRASAAEGGEAIERAARASSRASTDRRARYVCELVAVGPDGEERRGTGMLEGRIADEPRGTEGFGYDPVFVPDGEERTVAELGNDWKRRNSHRARAARLRSRDCTFGARRARRPLPRRPSAVLLRA